MKTQKGQKNTTKKKRDMGAVDHAADRHIWKPLAKYRVQGPTTNDLSPTKVSDTHWTASELDNIFGGD